MIEIPSILKNAADKCGLERVRYVDKDTPTGMDNITLFPFFGDTRSTMILSSILLKRYREEAKGSKYFIVCSWPGHSGIYPYADEYWSVKAGALKSMMGAAEGFINHSESALAIHRNLNHYFSDVVHAQELNEYYNNGLTDAFMDRFRHVRRFLPAIPSSVVLGNEFNRELARRSGNKIFLHPVTNMVGWKNGKSRSVKVTPEFYHALVRRLLDEGFVPVIYQDSLSYDLSAEFTDSCIYVTDPDITHVLSAMRATGCVLDLFNGASRWAILARCPFLSCDERNRYAGTKEWEIDDLCATGVPREYIFSFTTIIESGDKSVWKMNLYDNIIVRLNDLFSDMDRNAWPPTSESNMLVPYSTVREAKSKRLGTKFIRVPKI